MLQMHATMEQMNYFCRAIIHDSAVNGTRMSFCTGE
ncbi:RAxF-45 family protein [Halobacillus litoralis]|nr:RAxF-45 family protein [Halobacillus litoralis]